MFCPNRECPDFQETGRPGEYVDTVTVCPLCGTTLVCELPSGGLGRAPVYEPDTGEDAAEAETVSLPPPPDGALVALAAFDYPDEAEALIASLSEHGVAGFRFFDDGRDFADKGGIEPCTRVLVPESQAPTALRVLEQFELRGRSSS